MAGIELGLGVVGSIQVLGADGLLFIKPLIDHRTLLASRTPSGTQVPVGARNRPGAVSSRLGRGSHLVRFLRATAEPECLWNSPTPHIGLVMVDLNSIDPVHTKSYARETPRQLGRVALATMVAVNPVADLQRAGTPPMMEATPANNDPMAEHPVDDVTTVVPLLFPRRDQLGAVVVAERFECNPGHPRAEVLDAGLDRCTQGGHVVATPSAQHEPRSDHLARKTFHREQNDSQLTLRSLDFERAGPGTFSAFGNHNPGNGPATQSG